MEGTIGEIRMFAGNFAPRNWAFCDGQLLAIAQNNALFSILGTTYGGDGRTTFGLPELRGRTPSGVGNGPGLTNRSLGQKGGSETNTITATQMPSHDHTASGTVKPKAATGRLTLTNTPTGNFPAETPAGTNIYTSTANAEMGESDVTVTVANNGGGQSVNNMQPFLGMYYIICLEGVYPSRT